MDKSQLLEEYVRTRRPELRDLVITEYIPLVKSVCGKMSVYISGVLEMEDLYSYGIFGLIDAIDKYDPKMDNKFETYATIRIRGEVLDNVRKLDAVPRQVRKKEKEIKAAEFKLQNMGMYSEANLAAELEMSIEELNKIRGDLERWNMIWLDNTEEDQESYSGVSIPESRYGNPEDAIRDISMTELKEKLAEALDTLTEKEKEVVLMIYYEELSQKEAAAAMSISESRVSQLLGKALIKLKENLQGYEYLLAV